MNKNNAEQKIKDLLRLIAVALPDNLNANQVLDFLKANCPDGVAILNLDSENRIFLLPENSDKPIKVRFDASCYEFKNGEYIRIIKNGDKQ